MTATTGMWPYDIEQLVDGPIRCMWAPIATAIPTTLEDIFSQIEPYAATTGWEDFGATAGPWVYSRNVTATQYRIQQSTTAVREKPTETTRTAQVAIAEMRPEIVKMIEESTAAIETGVAAAGSGAYTKVPVGNIEDFTQYRMAFIGRRGRDQGIVTEPTTTKTRGRNFAFVANRCQVSAENVQLSLAQGDLGNANVTFRLFPDAAMDEGEEAGFWIFEDAGTFT